MRRIPTALALGAALLAMAACGGSGDTGKEVTASVSDSIQVSSTAFADGATIPEKYSCHGRNVSPPLAWTGVPGGSRAVALVVDDPDAPRGIWTHWVLFGLSPSLTGLAEGQVPPGARQAKNSGGDAEWSGPCPPSGTHHYRFTVYALDDALDLPDGADLDRALAAITDGATAQGRLVGLFAAR